MLLDEQGGPRRRCKYEVLVTSYEEIRPTRKLVNRTTNRADRVWSWRPPVIVGRSFSQTTSDRESDGVIQKHRSFRRPPSNRARRANGMRPTRRVLDSADAVELHANSVVGAQSEHAGRIAAVECVSVQIG